MKWLTTALLAAAMTVLGWSCGGSQPDPPAATGDDPARPERLPERRQRRAFEAQQEISGYCRRRAASLAGGAPPPSAAATRRAFAAADRLVAMTMRRPFDLIQTGVDLRLFTSDLVEDLGNLDCDPGLVRKLEEVLG